MREMIYEKAGSQFNSRVFRDGDVAIKTVLPKSSEAEDLIFREHDTLLYLRNETAHPELFVQPVDYRIEDGVYILVTKWLEAAPIVDVNLFKSQLYCIGSELARCGLVHRDIWMPNVIPTKDGPVLIDFAWCKYTNEQDQYDQILERANDIDSLYQLIKKVDELALKERNPDGNSDLRAASRSDI